MPMLPHALADAPDSDPVATPVCRACGATDIDGLLPQRSVPLYCNVLVPERDAALDAPRGALRLTVCRACGHVYNGAFDADALLYTPQYENSLHYSAHFDGYARDLARSLVDKYSLHGKFVVDVGCGLGDFLALLCRLGGNRGRGYDRSSPDVASLAVEGLDIAFVPEFFTRAQALAPIDFLCCRQVLEHIAEPGEFLLEITRNPAVTADTVLFFEVPNAAYTFQKDGIWDLIYEHCSYFGRQSLVALFERCGLEVLAVRDLFSGQYLGLEARPGRASGGHAALAPTQERAEARFGDRYRAKVTHWQDAVAEWTRARERVVIWGAGSKGVNFLDTLRPSPIEFAVDLNPRKQGRFLPGSGAKVVAPEFLAEYRPDRVILMNAVYRDEIAAQLARLGLSPTLVAA